MCIISEATDSTNLSDNYTSTGALNPHESGEILPMEPHIDSLLDDLLSQIQTVLGENLVGLYLYGSLVTGDFDSEISDIDLLAVTTSDLNETEFNALHVMQNGIVQRYRQWENRLELAYLSLQALQTFKTEQSQIAVISPGEPFHVKEAGKDWLVNWYVVREKGVTLFGPPPDVVIPLISKEEFIECVIDHTRRWQEWINDIHYRGSQAYAILTLCRALYTVKNGEQVSKLRAAAWAEKALPEWASTIQNAILWRQVQWREENVHHEVTLPETRRFVQYMIEHILHV
jgi:hypothetical protein